MVMKKWTSTLSFWSPFKKIGALSHAAIGWNKKNHNVCHFGSGSRSSSRFTLCTWPQVGQILPLHLRCRCPQKKAQNLLPILKSLKKNLVNYTHSFAVPDVPYSSLSGYISPEKMGAPYPAYPSQLMGRPDRRAPNPHSLAPWRSPLPAEKSPYFGPFRVEESQKNGIDMNIDRRDVQT